MGQAEAVPSRPDRVFVADLGLLVFPIRPGAFQMPIRSFVCYFAKPL
jgi:hypothetical protein